MYNVFTHSNNNYFSLIDKNRVNYHRDIKHQAQKEDLKQTLSAKDVGIQNLTSDKEV